MEQIMSQRRSILNWVMGFATLTLLLTLAVSNTVVVTAQTDVCSQPGYFDGPWDQQKQEDYERCQQQATSSGNSADGCVIPESGPWPPCATGGGSSSGNADDCVIPESGPWPPCATGGDNSGGDGGGTQECVIPESGPWPPCATGEAGSDGSPEFDEAAVEARIEQAIDTLEIFWKAEFAKRSVNYRPPGTVVIYRGDLADPPNAFYIPAADSIFIDLRLLEEVTIEFGMYAGVAVLAHEWGHFVQDQLDLFGLLPGLRQIELQADCMAGSYTTYERNLGLINAQDVESARDLFFSIGDDQINPGAPYDHPGAHGTAVERLAAFDNGLNTNAQVCIDGYR